MTTTVEKVTGKVTGKGRGFASMSAEKRKGIASKGGKTAQSLGTAHKFKAGEEASAAGKKGGSKSRRHSKNHDPQP